MRRVFFPSCCRATWLLPPSTTTLSSATPAVGVLGAAWQWPRHVGWRIKQPPRSVSRLSVAAVNVSACPLGRAAVVPPGCPHSVDSAPRSIQRSHMLLVLAAGVAAAAVAAVPLAAAAAAVIPSPSSVKGKHPRWSSAPRPCSNASASAKTLGKVPVVVGTRQPACCSSCAVSLRSAAAAAPPLNWPPISRAQTQCSSSHCYVRPPARVLTVGY
mmetsp:Transcript_12493/g.25079  ORF Transcript_12493/g.25079 Transcript_12493/m.25079 type:complete len:214 (-) Transcript_12493:106-747(-)